MSITTIQNIQKLIKISFPSKKADPSKNGGIWREQQQRDGRRKWKHGIQNAANFHRTAHSNAKQRRNQWWGDPRPSAFG